MSAKLVTETLKPVTVKSLKYGQIVRWCKQLCFATYSSPGGVMLVSLEDPTNTWSGIDEQIVTLLPKGAEVIVTAE